MPMRLTPFRSGFLFAWPLGALLLAACHIVPPAMSPDATGGLPAGSIVVPGQPAGTSTAAPGPGGTLSPTPVPRVRKLVAMGASDIIGYGATNPSTEGWAPVLITLLPGTSELVKLGFIGRLASGIREDDLPKAIAAKPDVVVLWTGVNDINGGVKVEDFSVDLTAILAGLEKTGAACLVLNLPDMDRMPAFKPHAAAYKAALPAWHEAVRKAGRAHGATVVELVKFTDEIEAHPEYLSADGFHPSTLGYKRLAEVIASAMAPALAAGR